MCDIFTRNRRMRLAAAVLFLTCLTHVNMEANDCGRPPEKPNASHNGTADTYPHRSLVRYTCERGFFQKGYPGVICNLGAWYGHPTMPFSCTLGSCNSPGLIDNGQRDGYVFSVGATVKYFCNEGYEMKGSAVRMCLASTSWSGKKPSCVPIRCPRLTAPKYGKVQPGGLEFGATARVTCDEGYRLIGPETRSCQADKTWSGENNSCEEITCTVPTIESGSVDVETPIKYGDIAIFRCDVGKTLSGKKSSFCVGHNEWSQTFPRCIDTCEVPDVINGNVRQLGKDYYGYVEYTAVSEDRVESGVSLYVSCDWPHSLSWKANTNDRKTKITCVQGVWDRIPKCKPQSCRRLSALRNGKMEHDGLEHGSRVRYSCDLGYTISSYRNRICKYGKWTGRKPWCKKNYCPYPKDLPQGMELKDYPTATWYEHDTVLRLECSKGYRTSRDEVNLDLTCYNTTWTISDGLRCEEAPCVYEVGDTEKIVSGAAMADGRFHHNSNIEIQCKNGTKFQLENGVSRATCEFGEWKPRVPLCEPASCTQTPSPLRHGMTQHDGLKHGSRIKYSCDLGYTLSNHQHRTCEFGKWGGRKPRCTKNYCPYPKDLPQGMELKDYPTATRYEHNDVLTLQCGKGYRPAIDGVSLELTCYNTTWTISDDLRCEEEVAKDHLVAYVPVPPKDTMDEFCFYNASQFEEIVSGTDAVDGKFPHNSSLAIVCKHAERFHLKDGVSKATCDQGVWQPRLPRCEPNLCDLLENISHGRIIYPHNDTVRITKRVPHRATAELLCDMGYRAAENNRTHCVYGTWSQRSSLACHPAPCFYKESKFEEMVSQTVAVDGEFHHNSSVQIKCTRPTFHLKDDVSEATCEYGVWKPREPGCKSVTSGCKDPGDIRNANKTSEGIAENGYYPSDEFLMYQCFKGFLADGISKVQEIFCLEDGTWSDVLVDCIALTCDQPGSMKGRYYNPMKKSYSYMETVTFSCEDPQQIVGTAILTCKEDGQWDNWEPECKVPQCPVLPWPESGRRVGNGRQVGNKVTFVCNAGFALQGSRERVCQVNKEWDGETTRCVLSQCSEVPTPENGRRIGYRRQVGDTVSFQCNQGYTLHGSKERVCQANQEWNGETTSCVISQCSEVPTPENGRRIVYRRQVGGTVSFQCNQGYTLHGSKERVCQANQEWSGETTSCVLFQCPELPHPENGYRSGNSRQIGDRVFFYCNENYSIKGSYERICRTNQQWDGETTFCVGECPYLNYPKNGRRVGFGRQVGDKVSFKCYAGYTLLGSTERTCQMNQEWDGETTRCVAESEPCNVTDQNAFVISVYRDVNGKRLSRKSGDTVKGGFRMLSRCETFEDRYFTGDSKRVCENGQWTGEEPKCSYIRLEEGKFSRRNYAEWSYPRGGITISDEGHLKVKKGSTIVLYCYFVGSEQQWSSTRQLHLSDMVLKADQATWNGKMLYTSKLKITDADVHHSDTYFCSRVGTSIPTGTFTIKVI
ncbi:sushi, von Willebrand factor type A, EGF and pentraxin domain-containing protein 1-like [Liolophura sinensis]|uniref:sushi, von Willebrand factor type A, EGF and pentraxin domain-containing protein 1-like n=1 Tax=Liolophura sinensis TaxID=3198878 RepID=UPI0031583CC6